jgi:hypothetical protein
MLREASARRIQHSAVDVDGGDVARDLCDWQSEPSVTAAQIDHLHARRNADTGDHRGRIRPQRAPPTSGRHFRTVEEAGEGHALFSLVYDNP